MPPRKKNPAPGLEIPAEPWPDEQPKALAKHTKYRGEFVQRVRALTENGAVDWEIAGVLRISLRTLYYWKAEHPDFADAMRRGQEVADDMVEAALFRRATGYNVESVKIITVPVGGNMGSEVREVPFVEHVPPDTEAAKWWLKNRRRDRWKDKHEVEHSGTLSLGDLVEAARKLPASS